MKTLVLFDVDGTIFDSQDLIYGGFVHAFEVCGLELPPRQDVLFTIGLSLDVAIARMAPHLNAVDVERVKDAYVHGFAGKRGAVIPFYDGMRELLIDLSSNEKIILGVATGKNRRGLDPLLAGNGLDGIFAIKQTAEFHKSKPDPAMVLDAIEKTGAETTVMIGDTSFDIEMGKAGGARTIGVTWGYHSATITDSNPDFLAKTAAEIKTQLDDWGML